jgi:hypothetical protein
VGVDAEVGDVDPAERRVVDGVRLRERAGIVRETRAEAGRATSMSSGLTRSIAQIRAFISQTRGAVTLPLTLGILPRMCSSVGTQCCGVVWR